MGDLGSMGEVSRHLLGGDTAASIVHFLVYGFALLGNFSYLLVIASSMQGFVYSASSTEEGTPYKMCLTVAAFIACILLVPLVSMIRRIGDSIWFCLINMILLMVALFMV